MMAALSKTTSTRHVNSGTGRVADRTVTVTPGEAVLLPDVNLEGARLSLQGDDLLVTLADGTTLLLEGLVSAGAGANLPSFEFAGENAMSYDDLITAAVTQAAPAAGGPEAVAAADDDGTTVVPTEQDDLGPALDALGALAPTALHFEAPEVSLQTPFVEGEKAFGVLVAEGGRVPGDGTYGEGGEVCGDGGADGCDNPPPGNDGDDVLFGGCGDDTLSGGGGDDVLIGGGGDDTLYGGDDNDIVVGQTGDDFLCGGAGADQLFGGCGDDTVYGGSGNDFLVGQHGDDIMNGGPGNDVILGGRGDDNIIGCSGDDTLVGGQGDDILNGSLGDDVVYGGRGEDTIIGGSGDDTMTGGCREADTFVWNAGDHGSTADPDSDVITDFEIKVNVSESCGGPVVDSIDAKDVLELSGLVGGSANLNANHIQIDQVGPDAVVSIDHTGGGLFEATTTITLEGVDLQGATLEELLDAGVIV